MNRADGDSHPDFTPRQGQYLAFIHAYTLVNGRPPAQADIQRFFRLTPPSVHQMLLTLERRRTDLTPRRGAAKHRRSGRSFRTCPRWSRDTLNRSKSLCRGYTPSSRIRGFFGSGTRCRSMSWPERSALKQVASEGRSRWRCGVVAVVAIGA